jgi:hypothetical protein
MIAVLASHRKPFRAVRGGSVKKQDRSIFGRGTSENKDLIGRFRQPHMNANGREWEKVRNPGPI